MSQGEEQGQEGIRIGVYVCFCGKNIAGVVDVPEVTRYASVLPNVVVASHQTYTCADPGQNLIKKEIREHRLNRVVVAACSPKLHEPTFRRAVAEAGLNPYLFEMVNIREHCSWVHMWEKEKATQKAKDLIRMGVAKARLLQPLEDIIVPVKREALIVGGGVSGCQAALDLGDMGFKVHLVEKGMSIGGTMSQLDKTFPTMDCSICILGPKLADVGRHPNIDLMTNAELKSVEGFIGNFRAKVEVRPRYIDMEKCDGCAECIEVCPVVLPNEWDRNLKPRRAVYSPFAQAIPLKYAIDKDKCILCGMCMDNCDRDAIDLNQKPVERSLEVGTIIVATGCEPFDARRKKEYGYGEFENVISSIEFERIICASGPTGGSLLRRDGKKAKRVGFIQCVGSRDRQCENEYCSFFCCVASLKQARLIKEQNPDSEIYIFYVDVRAFGKGFEELYARGQEEGFRFIRGRPSEIREGKNRSPIIVVEDTLSGELMEVEVDIAVLAVGIEPPESTKALAQILHIPVSKEGFILEAHPKLKPVDTPVDGIFMSGTAAQPRDVKDSVATGSAAAGRAAIPMSKGQVSIDAITCFVNVEKCKACKICETRCPYNAIHVKEKKKTPAEVTRALCKGCGTCVADCPFDALDQHGFTNEQLFAQIDAALEENPEEKLIVFACNWCSYVGSDMAGTIRLQYPTNARIIRTMCSGRVSQDMVLRAFEKGAGLVLVSGCHPADCHYISGNRFCADRMEKLKKLLPKKGMDPDKLKVESISATEGLLFQKLMIALCDELTNLRGKGKKPRKLRP